MALFLVFFLSSYLFYNVQSSVSVSEDELLPVILQSSKNAECQAQASDFLKSFVNGDEWAWQMVDANGKIPSGLQVGNSRDLGHFDECLMINNAGKTNIKGKYCYAGLSTLLPKTINITSLLNDTSVSNSSESNILESPILRMISKLYNEGDISELMRDQKIINKIVIGGISFNGTIPDDMVPIAVSLCLPDACLPSDLGLPNTFLATDDYCVTKDSLEVLDLYDYVTLSFFVLIFVIMLASTVYDVNLPNAKKSTTKTILTSFSIYTNGKELTRTTRNPNHLLCIDGIKTLSTLWIILGHRFALSLTYSVDVNTTHMLDMSEMLYSQYVQSALYAVDTFMVLSGCLMAYLSLKSMSQLKENFENLSTFNRTRKMISFTLMTYLHRYLRLTPAIAVQFIFYVTLLRHIGEGPVYSYVMDPLTKACANNWWSFFLYLENYVHPMDQCITHLWYLDVDMHVFLLSPFILWPIVYYRKIMLYFCVPVLTIISCVVVFIISYVKNLQWTTDDYFQYFYYPTHTRLAPWLIGIGLGTMLHNSRNTKFHIKKITNILIWIAVLVALVLLALGQQDPSYNYERVKSSIWISVNKPLWSLCICWIVWACVKGHGGFINRFLSCSLFQISSKLTFCMYLMHFMIIAINVAIAKTPTYFDDANMLRDYLADVVITIFAATLWTMAFEIPFRIIEKTLLGGFVPKTTQPTNVIHENKNGDIDTKLHTETPNNNRNN